MASIIPINNSARPVQSAPPNEGAWVPYQVDFTTNTTGKHIALTKRIVTWKFGFMSPEILINNPHAAGADCRGSEHEIKLIWSVAARKRSVLVDNTEVHFSVAPQRFPPPACPKFEHSFSIPQHIIPGYHEAHITAYATVPMKHDQKFKQFDLLIDGLSYNDFPRIYQLGTAVMRDSYYAHGRRALTCKEAKHSPNDLHDSLNYAPIVDPPPNSLPRPIPHRDNNRGASHHIDVLYDHDKPRSRNEEHHMVEFAKEQSLRELMKEEEEEMVVKNSTNAVVVSHQLVENRRLSGSSGGGNRPMNQTAQANNLDVPPNNPFASYAPTLSTSLPPSTRSDPQRSGQLFPHNSIANADITNYNPNTNSPRAANADLLGANLDVDFLDSLPTAHTPSTMPIPNTSAPATIPNAPAPLNLPSRLNPAAATTSPQRFSSMPPVQQTPLQAAPRSTSLYSSPPPPTWEEMNSARFVTPTWDTTRTQQQQQIPQQPPQQQQQQPQQHYYR